MKAGNGPLDIVSHFLHARLLWLLLGSYAASALWPSPGLVLRRLSFGEVEVFGGRTEVTLSMLLLALLLVNAGLGVRTADLSGLLRSPAILLGGLAGNLLVPIAFIFGVSQTMRLWHNPDEVQNILVGLALVASMPVAGSSTAWSQNANGNLALSLGLVLGSTLLSPLTTPAALHAVGFLTSGDYAEDLHELASSGAGAFLAVCVVLPSFLGVGLRRVIGNAPAEAARPTLKLANCLSLLALNYTNAAASLPQVVANPDWDFLAAVLAIVTGLCALAFAAGCLLARWTGADYAQRASLMFGLGMNNNGTGLVLASLALADHPRVLLPIICYNLVQHVAAGVADCWFCRPAVSPPAVVVGSPAASAA